MVNLYTKFSVFIYIRYEVKEGDAKYRKFDGLRSSGHSSSSAMSLFDTARKTSNSPDIGIMCLSCTVLEISLVTCPKSQAFPIQRVVSAPVTGDPIGISSRRFGSAKLDFLGYRAAFLLDEMFDRTPACGRHTHTDRQTDGRTQDHSKYRFISGSRSKNS